MTAPRQTFQRNFGRGLVPDRLKPLAGKLLSLPPVFRAWEIYAASRYPAPPAADSDGVPLPDRLRMVQVVGHGDWQLFLSSGQTTIETFETLLARHGAGFAGATNVLDFGCGCGRLIRHLPARTRAQLYGTDLNRSLARWCASNLAGTFSVNRLQPPLAYADGQMDTLYALSVFTHLREPTQRAWLDEFARILAPGGLAIITFHDEYQPFTEPSLREAVAQSGFLVRRDAMEGSNLPATYQSHAHISAMASGAFEVLETVKSSETPFMQAMALLRRRDEPHSHEHA